MSGGSKPGERRGGRKAGTPNKSTLEIKALAGKYAPAALKELARLSVEAESESARVAASNSILDRAYGKPAQSVEVGGPEGGPILIGDVSDTDRAKALAAFIAKTKGAAK